MPYITMIRGVVPRQIFTSYSRLLTSTALLLSVALVVSGSSMCTYAGFTKTAIRVSTSCCSAVARASVSSTNISADVGKHNTWPEVIKLFSCSTQLSKKFSPLINVKMPTTVGILTCMSGENNILCLTEP